MKFKNTLLILKVHFLTHSYHIRTRFKGDIPIFSKKTSLELYLRTNSFNDFFHLTTQWQKHESVVPYLSSGNLKKKNHLACVFPLTNYFESAFLEISNGKFNKTSPCIFVSLVIKNIVSSSNLPKPHSTLNQLFYFKITFYVFFTTKGAK